MINKRSQLREKSLILWGNLRTRDWHRWGPVLVGCLCVLGILARLAPIATSRFHQDEAIYSHWALQVGTGQDDWLSNVSVDKPPLYIYILALFLRLFGPTETAARLPSELAGALSLLLLYFLGRRLYGHRTALVALVLMAFSPFNILFAPTALTDPLMVAWVLAALVAATYHRWGWAGWFLGLGIITKPQAVLFLPFAIAIGMNVSARRTAPSIPWPCGDQVLKAGQGTGSVKKRDPVLSEAVQKVLRFAVGLGIAIVPVLIWDMLRLQDAGFFRQSVISYGGLRWAPPITWLERAGQWRELLGYVTGSPLLDTLLVLGLPILLIYGLARWRTEQNRWIDWTLTLFAAAFLLVHTVLEFNVWDRYLLGLVPIALLLLSRILILPGYLLGYLWPKLKRGWAIYGLGIAVLLALTMFRPAQDAANSRYPIGGAHGAYNGLDALANYFRGHVSGRGVLYHQWLGWHYSFYLFDFPYLFQWYTSPDELAQDAAERPGVPRYVTFPSWHSPTQPRWALRQVGLDMRPIYETYRSDGSRSFTLYRIEEMEPDD